MPGSPHTENGRSEKVDWNKEDRLLPHSRLPSLHCAEAFSLGEESTSSEDSRSGGRVRVHRADGKGWRGTQGREGRHERHCLHPVHERNHGRLQRGRTVASQPLGERAADPRMVPELQGRQGNTGWLPALLSRIRSDLCSERRDLLRLHGRAGSAARAQEHPQGHRQFKGNLCRCTACRV